MRRIFQEATGYIIVIGIIAALVAIILYAQKTPANPGKYAELIKENTLYHVVRMLDGDTLIANVSGQEVTVRLIGMDTPEVVDPRKPVQCYGPEASAKGKELLNGKEVYLEKESAKGNYDKYGRVLAYAHFADGSLYNEKMIRRRICAGNILSITRNTNTRKILRQPKQPAKKAKARRLDLPYFALI
jgi:endonuclease YncB( thermonuclease family)